MASANARTEIILRMVFISFLLSLSCYARRHHRFSRPPALPRQNGGENDDSLYELLVERFDVEEIEHVIDRRQRENAPEHADHCSAAAIQHAAADHDGSDRVELVADADA